MTMVNRESDFIIIGAGIVGISFGLAILERNPKRLRLVWVRYYENCE